MTTTSSVTSTILVVLALALVIALALAIYLLGAERLFTLVLLLIIGLLIVALVAAASLPIRAWRKNDAPPVVEHYYHDGTKTIQRERIIDTRPAPLPALPAPASNTWSFPDALRAAFVSGQLAAPANNSAWNEQHDLIDVL